MAQIEQSSGGKQKKGAQKKMQIHVDFTPMVDMNMLLITFFMLCTTMLKSQTLNIMLPSNEVFRQSGVDTILYPLFCTASITYPASFNCFTAFQIAVRDTPKCSHSS